MLFSRRLMMKTSVTGSKKDNYVVGIGVEPGRSTWLNVVKVDVKSVRCPCHLQIPR